MNGPWVTIDFLTPIRIRKIVLTGPYAMINTYFQTTDLRVSSRLHNIDTNVL